MAGKCKICAETLPEGARKCRHCGEFQTLLGRIRSGVDLNGLIALVPIATLAFAFLQGLIEVKRSDLRVTLVSCGAEAVTLFASNVGNRAGMIGEASYSVNNGEARPLVLALEPNARLLASGQTEVLELRTDPQASPGGLVPFEMKDKPECKVQVTLQTVAFDQNPESRTVACACPAS